MAPDRDSSRLLSEVARLDPLELCATVGALFLVPSNLHYAHRLEALASLIIDGHARGRGALNRTRARRMADDLLGSCAGWRDDPWPTLATENFIHHGGNHTFIPGGDSPLFVLRLLARIIATSDDLGPAFRARATRLIQFGSALSHDVASHAGLPRNEPVPPSARFAVPPRDSFERLRAAVCLSAARFDGLCRSTAVDREDALRFCAVPSARPLHPAFGSVERLQVTPVVTVRDSYVVVAPHLIAQALAHHVVALAEELGESAQLADELHVASFFALDDSLERLGMSRVDAPWRSTAPTPGSIVSHILYQCDRDKLHHVVLASDALVSGSRWSTDAIANELHAVRSRLPSLIERLEPPVNEWRSLVVLSGTGREFEFSVERDLAKVFALADCEVIAQVDGRDPLVLWKHHVALDDPSTPKLASFSPLDTYALWRAWGRRFTPDDDGVNFVSVAPDLAATMRQDAVLRRDTQALPWEHGRLLEVALSEGPERPVYLSRRSGPARFEFAVVTPPAIVWFVATPNDAEAAEPSLPEFGRMAAFWLSEFALELSPKLPRRAEPDVVVVHLVWVDTAVPYAIEVGPDSLEVQIGRGFLAAYDDTNAFERGFAAALATAVFAAVGLSTPEAEVQAVLDAVAPLGVKRMLHAVHAMQQPALSHDRLPPPRLLQDFDIHRARRIGLGDSTVGRLDGDDARTWLNATVSRLYEALRADLAEHEGADVLDHLLEHYEALVRDDDIRDLTFGSVLACAQRVPTLHKELEEQIGRHARAASACRFLIEHVVAEPTAGVRRFSVAKLDQWLALGAEIIGLGYASDVSRYQLADVKARIGRCGYSLDLGGFDAAIMEGRGQHHRERLALEGSRVRVAGTGASRANDASPPRWRDSEEPQWLRQGVDAELGCDLDELISLFYAAIARGQRGSQAVVEEVEATFVAGLAEALALPIGHVEKWLEHFSLRPRDVFLKAPPGYQDYEVWPWRFNRAWSYVRRPFVRSGDGNVRYTVGHVAAALENLMMLLTTGRYRAQAPELRRVLGRITQRPSREFVDQVANAMKSRGFEVRTHVSKVGRLKLERARGQSLGDVDVLAVHRPSRRILAVECKDFQTDRMPHEMSTDLEELFTGRRKRDGQREPSAQDRHLARHEWLVAHRDDVVRWLEDDAPETWTIEAVMVLRRALVTPYLGHARLPVWTLRQVRSGEVV